MARLAFLFICYEAGVANKCTDIRKKPEDRLRELDTGHQLVENQFEKVLQLPHSPAGLPLGNPGKQSYNHMYACCPQLCARPSFVCSFFSSVLSFTLSLSHLRSGTITVPPLLSERKHLYHSRFP